MKCTKTMLTTGAVAVAALVLAYAALPQFRLLIAAAGPYLLFLLCPLSMLFMMKGMQSNQEKLSSDTQLDRLPPGESHLKK
jgi:hypothetical protein